MSVNEKKEKNKNRINAEKDKLKILGFIHQSLTKSKYMISSRESAVN